MKEVHRKAFAIPLFQALVWNISRWAKGSHISWSQGGTPSEALTAARYAMTLEESGAVKLLKMSKSSLHHDNATVHTARVIFYLLKKEVLRIKTFPLSIENASSPDG